MKNDKHISKEDLHKDWLNEKAEQFIKWVKNNKHCFLSWVLFVLLVIGATYYFINKKHAKEIKAWENLYKAQLYLQKGEIQNYEKSLQSLKEKFPNQSATNFAMLDEASRDYRKKNYEKSIEIYNKIISKNSKKNPIIAFAYLDLAHAYQASENHKKTIDTCKRFLDEEKDHVLSPEVYMIMARSQEELGQNQQAKETYEKVSNLYPGSYWGEIARNKVLTSK
jgi:tetratricopeptide (TPR) repeat protein